VSKPSLRVYLVKHHDGRLTGILMRPFSSFFDQPPPAAYGETEEEVLARLEGQILELLAVDGDVGRYLWTESFEAGTVKVFAHPQSTVKKRPVIGKKRIPLRLTYVYSKVSSGGYRVLLPRFDWWLSVEDLSIVSDVVAQAVSSVLLGASPQDVYDFRTEGEERVIEWLPRAVLGERAEDDDEDEDRRPTLDAVADELVAKAKRGKLPATLGASNDLERLTALVAMRPLPSILLVGEAGVGKSTLVRRLARHLATLGRGKRREAPVPRLYATSGEKIIAGMIYLEIVNELSYTGDYLYVDRLLSIVAPQPDGASIADVFLPAIVGGDLSLIAECSEAELAHVSRKQPALIACFRIVRLAEMDSAEVPGLLAAYHERTCPEILVGGKPEKLVELLPAALRRATQHLAMYQREQRFPGKALRFLSWLYDDLVPSTVVRLPVPLGSPAPIVRVSARDISRAYARFSGLPVDLIADEHAVSVETLAAGLRRQVVGQTNACEIAARVLARFKAGMNDPERPLGTLLFIGPTGVGKTELAKALTRTMFGDEKRMIRLDMSEYALPGSAARLLDGTSSGDTLVGRIRQQPLSLVLFDEIEKAHAEVFDLLLGVLGEGRLTDAAGRLADFRMAVICLTSNLGVSETPPLGFGGRDGLAVTTKVRQHFRPELVNRIDHIVPFRGLDRGDVRAIVDLELAKAAKREGMVRRKLTLSVSDGAKDKLAELGFHPTRGARPLRRVLEELIMTPLSVRLAEDPSLQSTEVRVVAAGGDEAGGPAGTIVLHV
jgi:ATP-dependent Clp protease ATP-binding subunit ClpC